MASGWLQQLVRPFAWQLPAPYQTIFGVHDLSYKPKAALLENLSRGIVLGHRVRSHCPNAATRERVCDKHLSRLCGIATPLKGGTMP